VIRYRVLQCVAVCCSVLQCVAVRCRAWQSVAVSCSVVQCVAVCFRVLQCVAVCCSELHSARCYKCADNYVAINWKFSKVGLLLHLL